MIDNELYHYGVKGMRWGVRKKNYANKKIGWNEFSRRYAETSEQMYPIMTKRQYDNLSSKTKTISKGKTLTRISSDDEKNQNLRNGTQMYLITNKKDMKRYQSHLPDAEKERMEFDEGIKNYVPDVYRVKYKTNSKLRLPSDREQVDTFIKLIDDDKNVAKRIFDFNQPSWKDNNNKVGGIAKKDRDSIDTMSSEELGRRLYYTYMHNIGYNQSKLKDINQKYYQELIAKGYNAIHDDNDRGLLSDDPIMVLNSKNDLRRVKSTKITERKRTHDKKSIRELKNRRVYE